MGPAPSASERPAPGPPARARPGGAPGEDGAGPAPAAGPGGGPGASPAPGTAASGTRASGAAEAERRPVLTRSQQARRERVIRAALELGAEGGYDAVQMRDVAQRAQVALGTIYRYFPSKDALLAAVMIQWVADLEARVTRHPPAGATTAERVGDVLGQALRAMGQEPQLTHALVSAMTARDPAGVGAMVEATAAVSRLLRSAFPPGVDPRLEAAAAKAIGHVWWSATIAWANGMGDMDWVAGEVREATGLITASFDR